jgi:flagellar assembly protein FliH
MQKWCPEPLAVEPSAGGGFEPLATASVQPQDASFRPEAGFADPHNLLRQLSRQERAQVMELLEQDLRREYEERWTRDTAERDAAEAERLATEVTAHQQWQQELAAQLRAELEDALAAVVRQTAAMASLMAAKVVRREVATDPGVLVRALETVIYKAAAGCSLSVTVHPDDAAWLTGAAELRDRLRIREVKEDRRLERGGCLVKTDDLEWDATVERQLAVLAEALDEALATPPDPDDPAAADPAPPAPEDRHA